MTALTSRRFIKPFLFLSWLQLIHLVVALYDYSRWKQYTLDDYPFVWSMVVSNEWFKRGLSVATLALFGYMAFAYYQESKPEKETLCDQRRLARSVGDSPTGVRVGAP